MKRIYAVVIFAAAVLLAPIMQPGNAEAAYASMVYNFAVSTYDGSAAAIEPVYTANIVTNQATTKGILSTTDDYIQVGWRYYPGWSSPKAFYRAFDRATKTPYDLDYQSIDWSVFHTYKIIADDPWFDYVVDYYYDGDVIASATGWYDWQVQRWYAGALKSHQNDRLLTYVGGNNVQDFSMHISGSGNPGSLSKNRVNYQRHDSIAYRPIYFFENYCDFRAWSLTW